MTSVHLPEFARPYKVDHQGNNIKIQADKMFLQFCSQLDSKIESKCIKIVLLISVFEINEIK